MGDAVFQPQASDWDEVWLDLPGGSEHLSPWAFSACAELGAAWRPPGREGAVVVLKKCGV